MQIEKAGKGQGQVVPIRSSATGWLYVLFLLKSRLQL